MFEGSLLEIVLLVGSVQLLALASPGPDFALVLHNSVAHSTKIALWSAFGIAMGILVHVSYSLLGLNILLDNYPILFKILAITGASYFVWIGVSTLLSNSQNVAKNAPAIESTPNVYAYTITPYKAFKTGFLTNLLNPKVFVYFTSFFSAILSANDHSALGIIIGSEVFLLTWAWFSVLSLILAHRYIQKALRSSQIIVDLIVGSVFMLFGGLIFYSIIISFGNI